MFTYLNRKVAIVMENLKNGFLSKSTVENIANEEMKELKDEGILVKVTWNPFKCFRDLAQEVQFDAETKKVWVCRNLIRRTSDLVAGLKREKAWIEGTRGKELSNDEEMKVLIKACKAEFEVYRELDSVCKEEAARLCAKVQSKLKLTNRLNRNVDTWHFYTRQLVDDNWYVY
jgi:hypothetical protein